MTDQQSEPRPARELASYFDVVSIRDEASVSSRLDVRAGLCDVGGALRVGAITYAVDLATGLASGVAVLDRDLWVVTTDLDVKVTAPVTEGPLRVDAEVVRTGATTVVASFSLHDEGTDRRVGGGTSTSRPLAFDFDRSLLEVPVGKEIRFRGGAATQTSPEPLATWLGISISEDGSVEVELQDWLRNPWGILHGGVTACLVDVAGELAGSTAFGRPARVTGELVRYLAPAWVGPIRGVPRVLAVEDGSALVEVRVFDGGADDRLVALGSLNAIAT